MTDWLAELCAHVGVQSQYRSFEGQTVSVARETRSGVLRAMGLDAETEDSARATLAHLKSLEALRPAAQEVVVIAGQTGAVQLRHRAHWWLMEEGGSRILASGEGEGAVVLPVLPLGIHALHLRVKSQDFTTWILVRPPYALRLADRLEVPRIWGGMSALYGLTNGADAQIGSYELLGEYAAAIAEHGADFIGINPIHAMGQVRQDDVISPYSPSHREFLNTWHCAVGTRGPGDAGELVDYPAALREVEQALSAQFAAFCKLPEDAQDKRAFDAFVTAAGDPLHEFALFEALSSRHGPDWRSWPAEFRDHDASALAAFARAHGEAIVRSKWAQWQADRQLLQAQSRAQFAGMRVGLYLDLAVGPRLGGAETWARGTPLITGATLGAPPDPLGPSGQSWGLAPLSPMMCRAQGYAGFSRLLRAVMRHAGMIRIDHVLGLMRSFWIPEGCREGTYVSYPFDALLAVVAIESARTGTVVVGEDLGLVPVGLREKLASSGVYGLDVVQYMRSDSGGFVDTADSREMAVCTFATHDTPTIAGFFAADDARARCEFGGIDHATFEQTRADRVQAQATLGTDNPVQEVHRRLARARSGMVAIQLDDVAHRVSQQNLPGTVDEYPNWRLKAPYTVGEIKTSDAFVQLGADMAAQGRSNPKRLEKEHDLQDCSNRPD